MTDSMKNRFTKVMTLALLVALLLSTGLASTFAAGTGSITVHKFGRATIGSVTNNTYTGDKIDDTSALGKPLAGAGFTLYKLDTTTLDTAIKNGNGYRSHVINGDASVTFTLSGTGSPAQTTITSSVITGATEKLTDSNGEIKYTALDDGYYVLVETTTPAGYLAAESSVIRLPLTKHDGSGHNRDIHVYPKNESTAKPVQKFIKGTPQVLNVNDTIAFEIQADFRNEKAKPDQVDSVHDLRNDSGGSAVYGAAYIIDTIQPYFSFVSVDSVTLLNAAEQVIKTLGSDDYDIDASALVNGSGELKVSLTEKGIDEAIAADASSFVVTITTKFTGATSAEAQVGSAPVKNVVSSHIIKAGSPDDGDGPETEVNVPTNKIVLTKTDDKGVAFAGAKFRLATVATPLSDADYLRDAAGTIIELTTDASGKLSFYNLPYSEEYGTTYYLHEISTKAGWQLKTSTIAVTLQPKLHASNAGLLDTEGNWIKDAVIVSDVTVANYPNGTPDPDEPAFSLPLTGGRGVAVFTALGLTLMFVAAAVYLKKRTTVEL